MFIRIRWLQIAFFINVAILASVSGISPVWAGAGGADISSLLLSACQQFSVNPCPSLPTTNQQVIEDAAISGQAPADIRSAAGIPPGGAIDAGTFIGLSNPLAFVSPPNNIGSPVPTTPTNPAANAFLSATTPSGISSTTLDLNFQYRSRTTPYGSGQIGTILLPFVVADGSGNVLREVQGTLQLFANSSLDNILGDFTGTPQDYLLSALGLTASLDFSQGFATFDLQIPLVVGPGLGFGVSPTPTTFDPFIAQGYKFAPGLYDGINPIASFLDASFVDNAGIGQLVVHADLAIAFDGTTILSDPIPAPVPEPSSLVLLSSALLGLGLLHRRRKRVS